MPKEIFHVHHRADTITSKVKVVVMKRKLIAVLLLYACGSMTVHAADIDEVDRLLPLSLETLLDMNVSISTNSQKKLSKAPSVVSVITAEDIKVTGATNLTEALQSVPGVYIRNNLFGFRPWIYVRGASPGNVLLMVNGAPIKEYISNSGQYWKGIPVSIIERIEVIRGPGSALFGADAASGVINVITKTSGKIAQSETGVRIGSFDSQSAWLSHGAEWNGFDVSVTADISHTDGHSPNIVRDSLGSTGVAHYGYDNADVRLSVANKNWRLMADHQEKSDVGIGLTGRGVLDPLTHGSDSLTSLALLYNNATFARNWALDSELRYRTSEFSSGNGYFEQAPGFAPAFPDGKINRQRGAERRLNFEVSGMYSGFRDHAVRIGLGHVRHEQSSVEQFVNYLDFNTGATLPAAVPLFDFSNSRYAFLPEELRTNRYFFLQDVWTINENWELTLGGRQDYFSDFGRSFTPRAALVWQTTDRLTSKLMYGEAFRAPSFFELYGQTSTTSGNTTLKPERSNTLDLALSYLFSRDLNAGVSFYRFIQSDLISLVGNQYQNTGELKGTGVELEVQWQVLPTLRFAGNYSSRNEDSPDSRNFNVPKRQAYLRADWNFLPNLHWNLQANWISKHIFPSAENISSPIGAYAQADTTIRYFHGRQWEFAASVRNLFDRDVYEYVPTKRLVYNLPLPGRTFYAEARYKF
jgi:iron complex outermembrane receptor protein